MSIRTSATHPLRIDVVAVPGTSGEIGMTLLPGRRDALSPEGAWERDLAADFAVVERWQPAIVVTLVEAHEFARSGVPAFAERFARGSFAWLHLPIPDGGVPSPAFEERWREAGPTIRAALRAGKRVLVHCRAGLGRTGMIAARLLVELGSTPDAALHAVRKARTGTVETRGQERHVRAQTARDDTSPPAAPVATQAERRDRMFGAMLGAAIGDALGAAFEFVSSDAIEARLGGPVARAYRSGDPDALLPGHPPGMPTDDTAMTLALVRALLRAKPRTPAAVHREFVLALMRSGPYGALFWDGGPGKTSIAMLRAAAGGNAPFRGLDPNAGGNGAAMRAHPCGFFRDRATVVELAGMQARLSHPHPGAVAAAQTVALLVHDAVATGTLPTALPPEIDDPTMRAAWERAHRDLLRGDRLPPHLRDVALAGWETVAAAHAIAQLYADDVATGIGIAAASGRDTDTVATIVGALLGATHGRSALPAPLVAGLRLRETIDDLTAAFVNEVLRAPQNL